ncbi:hypothetical protein XELAEV_18036851mg [Xenopus laevis]|uniref:Acrosin-binding protein n=1 Tax=Xenopus laevis TaxID=8355 RepID=A0A974CAX1_XENLA|nr:hypothetical protein XELAEV_18036851mg [Xenopus laevis]
MPEPMAKSLCARRLVTGCEERTIRRFDAYENHGIVPTGPVCTDLKTVSRFDSFCDFARFRCLHALHYIKDSDSVESESIPPNCPFFGGTVPLFTAQPAVPHLYWKVPIFFALNSQKKKHSFSLNWLLAESAEHLTGANKRIPCEDNELMTIQTPAATSENDLSFKSTPPQEISTNNNQQILTELKAKRNIIGQQHFKTLEEPEYIEEVSDDDNIGFAGPQNTPSSGVETTAVTHKPTSHQQATPKRENDKVKHNAYEIAWTKLKPANNKETTPKPQATEETSEDSDTDDDLRGFAMPQNSPSDETNTAMPKPSKARSIQLEMSTKKNGAQKSFDGLNKPNSYELAWSKLKPANDNHKITESTKPQDNEETDRSDDIRGFLGPPN